jgi:5-oxoprolinase (ATP-hydrolysing)
VAPAAAPRFVPLFEGGRVQEVPLWPRTGLPLTLTGPALIVEPLTTLYLKSGWHMRRLADGSLLAERIAP